MSKRDEIEKKLWTMVVLCTLEPKGEAVQAAVKSYTRDFLALLANPSDRMVEAATEAYFNAFLDNSGQDAQMRAAIRAAMKAAGE